jgi:hypothetical protein
LGIGSATRRAERRCVPEVRERTRRSVERRGVPEVRERTRRSGSVRVGDGFPLGEDGGRGGSEDGRGGGEGGRSSEDGSHDGDGAPAMQRWWRSGESP